MRSNWTFLFGEVSGAARPSRFPHLARPDTAQLTGVLARLEGRGIMQIGRMWDHVAAEPGGWRIADPDIEELFGLLGPTADNASALDLSHHGEIGGWAFAFGYGHTSSADPDRFAAGIEALLWEEQRTDMGTKLVRSGCLVRIAALVFDATTGVGWSTGHLATGGTPTLRIDLPTGITHVLVLGMNGFLLLYSRQSGWSRPAGQQPAPVRSSTSSSP